MRKIAVSVLISILLIALPLRMWGQWRDTLGLAQEMADISAKFGNPALRWRLIGPDFQVLPEAANEARPPRRSVGSLGKVIVAMGIMRLVEQGKLKLEDPVSDHLRDLPLDNPWDATDPVRIVHLLEHSSGLDDMHFNEYFCYGPSVSLADALARNPHSKRIRWRPGTCCAYSNVGYAIAARIIEVVTGQAADRWLEAQILGPLQMKDSYFFHEFERIGAESMPLPGSKAGKSIPVDHYLYYPAVSLVSTDADLTRLMRFFMAYGRDGSDVLDTASVARMYRHESTPAGKSHWMQGARGLGFSLWGPDSDPAVRASGFVDGNIAQLCFLPRHGYGWILLSHATRDDAQFIAMVSDRLDRTLPNARWLPAVTPADEPLPHPPAGHYRYISKRNDLFSFHDDLYAGFDLAPEAGGAAQLYRCRPWSAPAFSLKVLGDGYAQWQASEGNLALAGKSKDGNDFLLVGEKYYEYSPSPWPAILRGAFQAYRVVAYCGLLMLLLTLLGRRLRGGGEGASRVFSKGAFLAWLLANLPYWCAGLAFEILKSEQMYDLGKPSLLSVGLLALSLVMPLSSIAAIVAWWRWREIGKVRIWKWLMLPLTLGNLALCAYLISYGLLPLVSWTF